MKLILQEKIANLGNIGDQVNVKPGYARNYLIPQAKAAVATAENIAEFEARRAELEKNAALVLAEAQKRSAELDGLEMINLTAKAGDEGKLFGSVGNREIAEAITAAGVEISKSEVHMPDGPIRSLGEHEVSIQVHSDVQTTVKLTIIAE